MERDLIYTQLVNFINESEKKIQRAIKDNNFYCILKMKMKNTFNISIILQLENMNEESDDLFCFETSLNSFEIRIDEIVDFAKCITSSEDVIKNYNEEYHDLYQAPMSLVGETFDTKSISKNVSFNKGGGGSISGRIILPATYLNELSITQNNPRVKISLINRRIIIEKE